MQAAKGQVPEHLKGHLFQPGNAGGGRPKSLLRRADVQAIIGRISKMSRNELQKLVDDMDAPILEVTLAGIYMKAASDSDASRMSFLLDRSVGRVVDVVEMRSSDQYEETASERRRLAKEMLTDHESFAAASVLAARASKEQLRLDAARREQERSANVIDVEHTDGSGAGSTR